MNQKQAHFTLGAFDIAAFFSCIWLYQNLGQVIQHINANTSIVVFESSQIYYLLLLIIPIIHAVVLVSKSTSNVSKWVKRYQLGILVISAVALITSKYIIQYTIAEKINNNDYVLCQKIVKGRYEHERYQKFSCTD